MAIAFRAAGTWTAGTTSIAPPLPTGVAAGDLMLLAINTSNQAVSTVTNWTQVTSSPVGTGTAGVAGGTRITLYYRLWQSGDAAPTVTVTSGESTQARIFAYSGVDTTTPFDATPVATTLATANTALTLSAITTVTANALIFWAVARNIDANATTGVTAFVNANLTSINERNDQTVTTGTGGGLWVGDGFKATASTTGTTAITQSSSIAVALTVALRPKAATVFTQAVSGSMTSSGNPRRKTSLIAKVGSITASASVSQKLIFTYISSGSITGTSTISRFVRKKTLGVLTGTGGLRKKTTRLLLSSLTSSGVVPKKTLRVFFGTITVRGSLSKLFHVVTRLVGNLTVSGTTSTYTPPPSAPSEDIPVALSFLRRFLGRR